MKEVKLILPDDAICGSVVLVSGGYELLNLRTMNFNIFDKSVEEIVFPDNENDEQGDEDEN